jgi:polyhydroxybutyrate depolymerase
MQPSAARCLLLIVFSGVLCLGPGRRMAPAASEPATEAAPTLTLESVLVGGQLRWYRVFVPATVPARARLPVVVCFHGGGGNATQAFESYGVAEEAAKRGWMAVFPEGSGELGGSPFFKLQTWNASDCCGFAAEKQIDDVGFFEKLVPDLAARYPADTGRIFLTGMSNGAMLSYRIAAERPGLIAGFAPVAGSLEFFPPQRAVPLLAIHGLLDTSVPFVGGYGSGISGAEFTSQLDSVLPFHALNGAGPIQGPYVQGAAQIFAAPGLSGGADTWYFLATDGGHSWPGTPGTPISGGVPIHQDVAATPLMFDFFALQPSR